MEGQSQGWGRGRPRPSSKETGILPMEGQGEKKEMEGQRQTLGRGRGLPKPPRPSNEEVVGILPMEGEKKEAEHQGQSLGRGRGLPRPPRPSNEEVGILPMEAEKKEMEGHRLDRGQPRPNYKEAEAGNKFETESQKSEGRDRPKPNYKEAGIKLEKERQFKNPEEEEGTPEHEAMLECVRHPYKEEYPNLQRNPAAIARRAELTFQHDFPTVEFGINEKLASFTDELGWTELEVGTQQVLERSHDNSPTDFYVQTMAGANLAVLFAEEIYQHVKTNALPLERKEIGSVCLAPFHEIFYRGEIIGVSSVENNEPPVYTVHFCDYGNEGKVAGKDIYMMPDDWKRCPRLAINCTWDMAITKELMKDEEDRVYKDPATVLNIRAKLTNGQYLVGLGAYVPKSKLVFKQGGGGRGSSKNTLPGQSGGDCAA